MRRISSGDVDGTLDWMEATYRKKDKQNYNRCKKGKNTKHKKITKEKQNKKSCTQNNKDIFCYACSCFHQKRSYCVWENITCIWEIMLENQYEAEYEENKRNSGTFCPTCNTFTEIGHLCNCIITSRRNCQKKKSIKSKDIIKIICLDCELETTIYHECTKSNKNKTISSLESCFILTFKDRLWQSYLIIESAQSFRSKMKLYMEKYDILLTRNNFFSKEIHLCCEDCIYLDFLKGSIQTLHALIEKVNNWLT